MHSFNATVKNSTESSTSVMAQTIFVPSSTSEGSFHITVSSLVRIRSQIVKKQKFSQDSVYCRSNRGLQKRIQKEAEKEGLKCQIRYWGGAWEVEEMFHAT
jgi:hypothetical protein